MISRLVFSPVCKFNRKPISSEFVLFKTTLQRQPKSTTMFSPSLDSSGTIGVLVATAIIGGTGVAAEKDLCNKWKDGDLAVLAMGHTSEDGSDFLILDVDFNGFQVPFGKFKHPDGSENPFLDLIGAKKFHLKVPSSMSKPTSSKGSFIYNPGHNMGDGPFIEESCFGIIHFFEEDIQLTMVPLNGGQVKVFKARIEKLAPPSDVLLTGRQFIHYIKSQSGKPFTFGRKIWEDAKGWVLLNNSGPVEPIKTSAVIEGGYTYEDDKGTLVAGFGIINQDKAVYVLKPDSQDKVPFKKFFVCDDPSGSKMGLIYGVIGAFFILLILAVIGFFLFTKGKKIGNKSLTKVKPGKSKIKSKASPMSSLNKFASMPSSNSLRICAPIYSAKSSTIAGESKSSVKPFTGKIISPNSASKKAASKA